jgi:hypothetical protein
MNHPEELHDSRPQKKWRSVNVWSVKGPFFVLVALLGLFAHTLHSARALIAAVIAVATPIIGYRDYWNEARFWVTVLLVGAVQVPLVIAIGPLIEAGGFPLMVTFGIFDFVLVALAISWVCSE